MKYTDARRQIRDGDILAVRGTSLLSEVIKLVTGGPWSHVAVAWWLDDRLVVVQQREFAGCQIVPASRLLPFEWVATGVTFSARARSAAFRTLGQSYSYLDALRIGLGLEAVHRGRICSTFAASILNLCGRRLPTTCQSPASVVDTLVADGCAITAVS